MTNADIADEIVKAHERIGGPARTGFHFRNTGNAHGRLEGYVSGTDARGKRYAFAPSTFPVLPGETRDIALVPEGDEAGASAPELAYPVVLKGRLDWGSQQLDVDATFAR